MFYKSMYEMVRVMKMEKIFTNTAKILKAISDPKRLRIVNMLSCGKLCACEILEEFQITQPTLSHDMKLLVSANIVDEQREGKNIYYSVNQDTLSYLQETLDTLFKSNPDCICHKESKCQCEG